MANFNSSTVSVIDTASNSVVATVNVGNFPIGVAVTPDGKHAYVVDEQGPIPVIDTATNNVGAVIRAFPSNFGFLGVAITPDGKQAYVTDLGGSILVIDTGTNTVVATIPVSEGPEEVAFTPDGKHAYVTDAFGNVLVIATATNKAVARVPGGPGGIAITPDGKHAYVANSGSHLFNTVSVIDTTTNKVVGSPIPVGSFPQGVGIIPPPPGIPFSAFMAKLEINLDRNPNEDSFFLESSFTLGSGSNGIHPDTEKVTLEAGTFSATIPPGSFKGKGFGPFTFTGVIDGAVLAVTIEPTGAKRFALEAAALDANLKGTKNPVPLTLIIGNDSGTTSVKANIN